LAYATVLPKIRAVVTIYVTCVSSQDALMRISHLLLTPRLTPLLAVYLSAISTVGTAQQYDAENEQATNPEKVETVIVTARRTAESGFDLATSWAVLDQTSIERVSAQHSNQLFNRVSGTWVSRGNGQESLVSLRSPVLTGAGSCGAFMTAQDGISMRSPGFCNVNQLFDANLLQAGRVEVLKGPGAVVFGSNALYGIINVVTRSVDATPNQVRVEGGSRDYYRVSASGAVSSGIALSAQTSQYGGYQDASGYDQQKATLRIDQEWGNWRVDGALEGSKLDQETAGYIGGYEAYKDDQASKENPNPEAYRNAWSGRGHIGLTRDWGDSSELTIRPFWRSNSMTFLQHYLPWKATETNRHHSVGVQISARGTQNSLSWLVGIDADHTEGALFENQTDFFSPNQPDGIHYDYDVDADTVAAFTHLDWSLTERWQLGAGIRLEDTRYDYANNAADGAACAPTASACRFYRPADRKDSFSDWTGNLSISHHTDTTTVYGQVARGFRAPQTTELYRLQAGQTVAEIDSEEAESVELGVRGAVSDLSYDLSVYWTTKENVIFQDRDRFNVSGAETTHRGVELAASWRLSPTWAVSGNASYARHRYNSDIQLLGSRGSIDGNDIDTAPKHFGSVQLSADLARYNIPITGELEWVWLSKYWLDPNNQHEYEGHDLLNLRASWQVTEALAVSLVATNLLDEGYAERADYGFGSYRYFVGEPRSAVLGITFAL
jgi:outer membrane receptor protein involved in Fe transport